MPLALNHKQIHKIYWSLTIGFVVCFGAFVIWKEPLFVFTPFLILAALFVLFYDLRVLFFLLLFFIPFSIEYAVTPSLSTDLPDEPLMIALAGCILLWGAYQPSRFSRPLGHPLFQLLLAGFAWTFITLFFSYEKVIAVKYFLAKGWYILAFAVGTVLLIKTKRDFVWLGICYALPMLLILGWTLYNHAYYGFSFQEANHVMQPFFRNHVNYSSLLVCMVPLLYLFYRFTNRYKKLLIALLFITLAGIIFSYARGAWLALIAGGCFVYILKRKWLQHALITVVAAIIVTVSLLIYNDNYVKFAPNFSRTIYHTAFKDHMVATYELRDVSNAERFYRWIAGVRMSKQEWLTGYGPNNFYDHYKQFADKRFRTWVSNNEDHSSVHNYFLLLLIEQGLPALLLFGALLYTMFMYVQRLYYRVKDIFYKEVVSAIGVILTMITTVIMLSDLIETDKIGGLFYVCLGLLVVIDLKTKEEPEDVIPA